MKASISVVDLGLSLLLLVFLIAGGKRGMLKELFSLFLLLVGLLLWDNYQVQLVRLLAKYLGWFTWLPVATFTLLLLVTLFLSMLLDSLIFHAGGSNSQGGIFIPLGAVVGLCRGVLLCVALLWIIKAQPFKPGLLDSFPSVLIPKLSKLMSIVGGNIPPILGLI